LGEAFLEPTKIYVKPLMKAIRQTGAINALAHITGGGFTENIPRVLPDELGVEIDLSALAPLPVFGWLSKAGGVAEAEMLRTFNCGVGMVLVVNEAAVEEVSSLLSDEGENVSLLGHVIKRDGEAVVYNGSVNWR
jgi:phosphoribosylformylglycinamidine cyclo-ligase